MAIKTKNKSGIVVGIIILVTVLAALVFLYYSNRILWIENYNHKSTQPYGTKVFFDLMQKVRGNQTFVMLKDSVNGELPVSDDSYADNYIYIGTEYYADTADLKRLLDFVAAGNKAFIISNQSNLLLDSLLTAEMRLPTVMEDPIEYHEDSTEYPLEYGEPEDSAEYVGESEYDDEEEVDYTEEYTTYTEDYYDYTTEDDIPLMQYLEDTMVLIHQGRNTSNAYRLSKYFDFKRVPYYWSYLNDSIRTKEDSVVKIIGNFNEEYINYISFKHGKGEFYIHTTPLIFTNYYMLNDTAMNYCRNSLQYMGNGTVYWDEENRVFDFKSPTASDQNYDPNKPQEGPLEFILSEPSFRKAWYLMLAATLLYLFFGSRRKQRVLQTMDNMENTSIEYTEVISQMFMNQKDHKKLVTMKMEMFKTFLRDRYGLRLPPTMREEDDTLYLQISTKTGTTTQVIKDIFEDYKILGSIVEVETNEMLTFHNKLNRFYNTCK